MRILRYAAGLAATFLVVGSLRADPLITDRGVYLEPELPALPAAAGGVFTDPVFGTQIMRISDESDGWFNRTAYSSWPTFNVDNTRLHFMSETPTLYEFDPETFTLGAKSSLGDWEDIDWEDAIWSSTDPDIMYRREGFQLYEHNVATQQSTLLKDFTSSIPEGLSVFRLGHMTISEDNNRFSFTMKPTKYSSVDLGYLAWDRDTDNFVAVEETTLHAAHLDKTGQHLLIKTGQGGAGAVEARVVDLATGITSDLQDGPPDYAPGHYDVGTGTIVGLDDWRNGITLRDTDSPHDEELIFEFPNWTQGRHLSLLAENEDWTLVSSYSNSGVVDEFDNEIYLVANDGSGAVRRIAHHRSVRDSYWDAPRANISRDGRFVAFTSNWGDSFRHDVFVVAVPAGCVAGDANCDAVVDIAGDIQKAFSNYTGPGSFGKTREQGDVYGSATGSTTLPGSHDGDVDIQDILLMFENFTGPADKTAHGQPGLSGAAAADPTIPDLIYNPATGEVVLDVDGSGIIGYTLGSSAGSLLAAGHTPILGGVGTSLPTELSEAGLTSASGVNSIGIVLPIGLDLAELSALLSTNHVSRSLGSPLVPFDLVVLNNAVPELSTSILLAIGMLAMVLGSGGRRRSQSCD